MRFLGRGLALVFWWSLLAAVVQADQKGLDYPHNSATGTGCNSCHYLQGGIIPSWVNHIPEDIDDTPFNNSCKSCHDSFTAPHMDTHSSLTTSAQYGAWSMECRVCHWPHNQPQFRTYKPDSYLVSSVSSEVTTYTLKKTGAEWAVDAYKGMILIPDTTTTGNKYTFHYKITGNTSDTITVKSAIDAIVMVANKNFAVIYGKLIKSTITTPNSGDKPVRFFRPTGTNSFADGVGAYDGVCEVCHTKTIHYRNDGSGTDQSHASLGGKDGDDCMDCHSHANGFKHGAGGGGDGSGCSGASSCHQAQEAHPAHVGGMLSGVTCLTCHQQDNFPLFADGQNLTNTTVCNNCHSANGVSLAKQYFGHPGSTTNTAGSWAVVEGEKSYCGSCHDSSPGNTKKDGSGDVAANILGNDTSYGFYITGHGKPNATYQLLAWQDSSAAGNPGANRKCSDCHSFTSEHFNTAGNRLTAANDQANSNCNACHAPAGSATANPQYYTTSAAYESSAHGGKLCTDCHEVHGVINSGAAGTYAGMIRADKQNLCYQCHSAGVVTNNAISGSSLATNIQQAFGMTNKHDLGTSFTVSGKTYSLECTSCHNVHLITGKYWDADSGKSPITRFTDNTTLWGASAGQKLKDYAGSGKYQKPLVTPNTYASDNLPDYNTFCLDCHSSAVAGISAKDWTNDPHGKKVAGLTGQISGGGVSGSVYAGPKDCPDWIGCGRALDWGDDRCSPGGSSDDCWPVVPKGAGTSAWVKGGYIQEERNAGANYVLSCTDCHEAHGSDKYKLLRKALNREYDVDDQEVTNDRRTWDGNGVCYQCHYQKTREHSYNPGWHNNGTCGTGPCHQPDPYDHASFGAGVCYGRCHSSTYVYNTDLMNDSSQWATFHENRRKGTTPQLAPSHETGLVIHYKFENNLKDYNVWNLHGLSFNGSVSYTAGKVGSAVVLNDRPIEVGTEETQWNSANLGATGNISKITEMKYHTTVEAWVYPTSSPSDNYERKIMAKHNYWSGGYALVLRPVSGQYRVGFVANVGYGGPTSGWDTDAYNTNGLRGAYSTVTIPLNEWSHVAATFDHEGANGSPSGGSVGKIRIYVNGHDVTTSDAIPSAWAQPQDPSDPNTYDQAFLTPYTEVPWASGWLATAFSVGGLNWSAPNDNFVGRLDEVKLWNITKPVSYFDAINAADPPRILSVVKGSSPNQLVVTFNEGAYANTNMTGDLQPSDFVFTDSDNGRTIAAVSHTAGNTIATLTLSSALDYTNDFGVDTVATASNAIFDDQGSAMGAGVVTISGDDGVAPTIVSAVVTGANKIKVTFSEGVYTNTGAAGVLEPGDLVFTDTDNGRTITAVTHTAGSTIATLTLSANLDSSNDIGVDTVKAASNAIYDDLSRPMGTTAVTITGSLCPSQAVFQLNEPNASASATDEQGLLTGVVIGGNSFTGDGYYHGSGTVSNYIKFESQPTCLQATTALTLEAVIKPAGIPADTTSSYTGRVFSKRDDTANDERYQVTIWRIPTGTYPNYRPASGVASIALWTKPVDAHSGNAYKPVLTEATTTTGTPDNYCPIVNNHWYNVKVVFNTNKAGGTPGQFFVPADIFVEDWGTDGLGAGRNWIGLLNCTDTNQSQLPDSYKYYTGDSITAATGRFNIGSNKDSTGNFFNGLMDWLKVKDAVD